MSPENARRRPVVDGTAPMETVEQEPGSSLNIVAPTTDGHQSQPVTRADVDILALRVRTTGMAMSSQASRDDRRLADGAEGPDGWMAAHWAFVTAVDALHQVALRAVAP